jgi:hypothetical protein
LNKPLEAKALKSRATVSGLAFSKLPLKQDASFARLARSQVGSGRSRVVCDLSAVVADSLVLGAAGDVSAAGTNYLILGAVAIALVGTAFPILFSRKDTCPECDGAGFVRAPGSTLTANAARKDLPQIVCKKCNGLGKLGQTDK